MPISNARFQWIERQVKLWNLTDVETMDHIVAREQFAEARAVLSEIVNAVNEQDNRSLWSWVRARFTGR
jgi:hypothetical protein